MCLLIVAPKGAEIPTQWLSNAWIRNPDGAGITFHDGTALVTTKGLMTWEAFEAAWKNTPTTSNRLIHFRFATLGIVDEGNTHPFQLSVSGAVVGHNGPCLHEDFSGDGQRSDSRHFAEDILSDLNEMTIRHLAPVWESFIESGNKLGFMFADGDYLIIGEKHGKWLKGVWLSNTHSIEEQVKWDYSFKAVDFEPPVYLYRFDDPNSSDVTEVNVFYWDAYELDFYSYTTLCSLAEYVEEHQTDVAWLRYAYHGTDLEVTNLMEDFDIKLRTTVTFPGRKDRFKKKTWRPVA